jgi:hypothetical protein
MKYVVNNKLKRITGFFIIMLYGLIICSCNKTSSTFKTNNAGTIASSKLTDREKQLIGGIGAENVFVFDTNLKGMDINWVECWVDFYENGIFINKITGVGTDIKLSKENNGIIMLSLQDTLNEMEPGRKWITSYNSINGGGTGSIVTKKSKNYVSYATISKDRTEVEVNKDINLAIIQEGTKVISITQEVFKDIDSYIRDSSKDNNVYVFKCKYIKK